MRIGLAYLLQETNSFSPVASRLEDFAVVTGQAVVERWAGTRTEIGAFIDAIGETEHQAVPLFAGWAMTQGPIERPEFDKLLRMVRAEIIRAGALDAVLIALHGAMAAVAADDCEGAIVGEIRSLVGGIPIVLTLDLHANLTARMVDSVTALVGYHTYPHVDMYETGRAGAELLLRTLAGEIRPVMAVTKIPLIVPAENMMTTAGPFARVFALGKEALAADRRLLAYSVFGMQPWLDVAEAGAAALVVSDGAREAAAECSRRMAQLFWDQRAAFDVELMTPQAAVAQALAASGQPVVLAEPADSPTAGSPGDSADLLAAFHEYAPGVPAALWVHDERVAAMAWEARPGTVIRTIVGGMYDQVRRKPVPVEAVVRSISDGRFVLTGGYNRGMRVEMGRTAVVSAGPVQVVVSEKAVAGICPEVYRSQGVEPRDQKMVVAKSATGFRSEYGPFAAKILIVDTPGASSPNLRRLDYRNVPRPIYPLDEFGWLAGVR